MRSSLLALWGLVLLVSSLSGRLDLLLRGIFHPLVGLSGAVLLVLAALQLPAELGAGRRPPTPKSWWISGVVALLVLVIAPNPSFSDLAANRPAELGEEAELSFLLPPAQRSLTDWVRLLRTQSDPRLYVGDPVRISGFVLPRKDGPPLLARLLVRCCLADGTPIGLPVRWPAGNPLPKADQWLQITGSMAVQQGLDGEELVVIPQRISVIPRPRRPLEP